MQSPMRTTQLEEDLRSYVKKGLHGFKSSARKTLEPSLSKVAPTEIPGYGSLCKACSELVQTHIIGPTSDRDSNSKIKSTEREIVITKFKADKGTFPHLDHLGALRASAQAGCHLCALLDFADPLYPSSYDTTTQTPYLVNIGTDVNLDSPGTLTIVAGKYSSNGVALINGKFKSYTGRTLRNAQTDAPEVSHLVKRWLRTCLETHEGCHTCVQLPYKRPYVPTRLIKIKAIGNTLRSAKLLIEGSRPDSSNFYLTLSHCWGNGNIIRLTESSLNAFQHEIPLSDLPKTFVDAFQITVNLGYKYIWIDSLCIIQDCKEDWEREAKAMGDVYQNSVCTIAAAGASDSYGGCFAQRSALGSMTCPLFPEKLASRHIYAKQARPKGAPTPLLSRAWVVQERLLSVRTISYGRDQVSWECVEARASERDPAMDKSQTTSPGLILKRDFYDMLNEPLDKEQRESTHAHRRYKWWSLVSAYTKCQMTYDSDKWAAFQGLGMYVSFAWGQKLLHGLWEHDLVQELLWNVSSDRPQKRLAMEAPSWSWLSVSSEVFNVQRNHFSDSKICAEVRKAAASTPSWQLKEPRPAALEIKACFLRLASETFPSKSDGWYNCRLRDSKDRQGKSSMSKWNGRWTPDTIPNDAWETYAVHMISYTPQFQVGLVVVPVDRPNHVWRRVGFYEIFWDRAPAWVNDKTGSAHENPCGDKYKTNITLV
ncbi:heterokaryon incompatibility protein-domain-containing protein [Pyrenochaeta sp. MPI-SDFR-AT-0127]|nr:heterokaryon incompatibility protein-domain-containing protein [Pyrenochaeta sp. MPI-SDFR-AT-0127]